MIGDSVSVTVTARPVSVGVRVYEFSEAFVGPDSKVKRTGRETTQSTREHLVYWATGLQTSFLEGAFNRAT